MNWCEKQSNFFRHSPLDEKSKLGSFISSNVLPIVGDRIQLQQVILNLVVNAIDAMADTPSDDRTISIQTSRIDNFAELTIRIMAREFPKTTERGLRTIRHQQIERDGHGTIHCADHCGSPRWTDIGE